MRMVPRNVPEEGVHHGEPRCVISDCVHRAEVERLRALVERYLTALGRVRGHVGGSGADLLDRLVNTPEDAAIAAEEERAIDAEINAALRAQRDAAVAIAIRLAREVSEPKLRRAGLDDLEATVPGSTDGLDERLMPREE